MKNTKKLISILLLSVVGLFFLTNSSLSQQSTDQLFEKALYLEDATGDLQQAIEIYQQILKDNPENRNVGARALLHMGICYEKLGLRQARGTYQDVIKKYPDQQGEVATATERLNRLNQYAADINKKAEQHFKNGDELMKLWEYEAAIAEYENAIKLDPNTLLAQNARYCIGQCWFKSGQYETALATFEKLIKDFPESNIAPVTELMISQVKYAVDNQEIPNLSTIDSDGNTIVDPKTGITYNKIKTFAGKNEVYMSGGTNMSSDCRFMVSENRVVPMDGSDPFNLVDMDALRAIYSPDMKKAAFYADSAIWTVPVSPETGRSTGNPQKLLDGNYRFEGSVNWSPDGSQFAFQRVEKTFEIDIWTISIAEGDLKRITNSPGFEGGQLWSPDGKSIAYWISGELWLASVTGNSNKMLLKNGGRPAHWSSDSKWLYHSNWENSHFYSLNLNKNFELAFPEQVGDFVSFSPGGDKMLFYRSSYDTKWLTKIVSSSGGASYKPAENETAYGSIWLGDSKHIMVQGENEQEEITYKMISLSGENSISTKIEGDVDEEIFPFDFLPDFKHIAFSVKRVDGKEDLYIAPFSVQEAKTTGPSRMIFEGWSRGAYNVCISWSPDGKKMALIHEGDIWMIPLEGGNPVQLTETPAEERWVDWSPDGKYISYIIYNQSEQTALLHVIQPEEGISRIVNHDSKGGAWNNDSESYILFTDQELQLVSLDGKILEHILNFKDLGIDRPESPCLSPDGKHLAFIGYEFNDKTFIIKYSFDSKKITRLAQDNLEDYKYGLLWSPDGKWLSYLTCEGIKVRPESSLWEADFEEVKQRLQSQE